MKIRLPTYNGHICIQWSTLRSSGLISCDDSLNILVYRNEFVDFIFTMLQQRIRNQRNYNNRGLIMVITFTMNVFEFEEVICMSS